MKNKTVIIFGVIIFSLGLYACKVSQPVRLDSPWGQSAQVYKDWTPYFSVSSPIDSFRVLHTGAVRVPLSGMLNTDKLPLNHGLEPFLWVDVYAYLFHHHQYGWMMIDTGLDSTFQQEGNISGLLAGNYIKSSKQEKGRNIGAQLQEAEKAVKGIFLTHLHGDHTAGLPEIDAHIPKYVGKGEPYIQIPLLYRSNHLSKADTLFELDWTKGHAIPPFQSVVDVFGDGTFWAIHTPGHASGHMSYLLFTKEGGILLTGDASHTKYGFEHEIEPGWMDNRELGVRSLKQLTTFKQMYPQVSVIYGHER